MISKLKLINTQMIFMIFFILSASNFALSNENTNIELCSTSVGSVNDLSTGGLVDNDLSTLSDLHSSVANYISAQTFLTQERLNSNNNTSYLNLNLFPKPTFFEGSKVELSESSKINYRKILGLGVKELVRLFIYIRINRAEAKISSLNNTFVEEVYAFIMDNFLSNYNFLRQPYNFSNHLMEQLNFNRSDYSNRIQYEPYFERKSRTQLVQIMAFEFIEIVFKKYRSHKGLDNLFVAIFMSDLLPEQYRLPEQDMVYNWTWLVRLLDTNFEFSNGQLKHLVVETAPAGRLSRSLPFDKRSWVYAGSSELDKGLFSDFFSHHVFYTSDAFLEDPLTYLREWSSRISWNNSQNLGLSLVIVELARTYSYLELANKETFINKVPLPSSSAQPLEFFWNLNSPNWNHDQLENTELSASKTSNIKALEDLNKIAKEEFSYFLGLYFNNKSVVFKPKNLGHFTDFAMITTILDPLFLEDRYSYLSVLERKNLKTQKLHELKTYTEFLLEFLDFIDLNIDWQNYLVNLKSNKAYLISESLISLPRYRSYYWQFDFNVIRPPLDQIKKDWDNFLLDENQGDIASLFSSHEQTLNHKYKKVLFESISKGLTELIIVHNNGGEITQSDAGRLSELLYIAFSSSRPAFSISVYTAASRETNSALLSILDLVENELYKINSLENQGEVSALERLNQISSQKKILLDNESQVFKRLEEILYSYKFILGGIAYLDYQKPLNPLLFDDEEVLQKPLETIADFYIYHFLSKQLIRAEISPFVSETVRNLSLHEIQILKDLVSPVEYVRLILKYQILNPPESTSFEQL